MLYGPVTTPLDVQGGVALPNTQVTIRYDIPSAAEGKIWSNGTRETRGIINAPTYDPQVSPIDAPLPSLSFDEHWQHRTKQSALPTTSEWIEYPDVAPLFCYHSVLHQPLSSLYTFPAIYDPRSRVHERYVKHRSLPK